MKLSVSIPAARQGRESHLGLTYDEDTDRVEIYVPTVPRMASATTSVDAGELDKAMTALRRSKPPKPVWRGVEPSNEPFLPLDPETLRRDFAQLREGESS